MSNIQWEEVSVPRGAFISWGTTIGQHVTGKVLAFDVAGGSDFNGNSCPQLSIELTEQAASINKAGDRFDHATGDLVVLNCGQASLKRAVLAAQPNAGDLIKITLAGLEKAKQGQVKVFDIKVARGAGGPVAPAQAAAADSEAEAPF